MKKALGHFNENLLVTWPNKAWIAMVLPALLATIYIGGHPIGEAYFALMLSFPFFASNVNAFEFGKKG